MGLRTWCNPATAPETHFSNFGYAENLAKFLLRNIGRGPTTIERTVCVSMVSERDRTRGKFDSAIRNRFQRLKRVLC